MDFNKIDNKEIFNSLLSMINNLYKKYEYLNLSKKEYYEIVLNNIEKYKKQYNDQVKFTEYMKKILELELNSIKKNLFSDDTKVVEVLNNYINKKYNDFSYDQLIQFCHFYSKNSFNKNINIFVELININNKLSLVLEKIYKQNLDKISNYDINDIFNDKTLCILMESYCMINNIDIYGSEIISSESYINDDSVDIYLKEISKIPILSQDEEKELFKKTLSGDKSARKKFLESNLKLVAFVAKKYIGNGLDYIDLIGEGNLGLIRALEKFDINMNYKFSTYATLWIKSFIQRAIENYSRTIRIPVHAWELIKRYNRIYNNLYNKIGTEPALEEIAKEMKVSTRELEKILAVKKDSISINEKVNDKDETEYIDFVACEDEPVDDQYINKEKIEEIQKLFDMSKLNEREKQILMMRNGFDESKILTQAEIGRKLGLTRERVRQLEANAIKKLRQSPYAKKLAVYMNNEKEALDNLSFYRQQYKLSNKSYKTYLKNKKNE